MFQCCAGDVSTTQEDVYVDPADEVKAEVEENVKAPEPEPEAQEQAEEPPAAVEPVEEKEEGPREGASRMDITVTTDGRLGCDFLTENKIRLVISKIQPDGPLARFAPQVEPGSVVWEVNGKLSQAHMLEEIRTNTELKMTLMYWQNYTINVRAINEGEVLGLDLKEGSMLVKYLTLDNTSSKRTLPKRENVALATWNLACDDGEEILPGDEVIAVNGRGGTQTDMTSAIKGLRGTDTGFALSMHRRGPAAVASK